MIQLLQQTTWQFLAKLNQVLSYDPVLIEYALLNWNFSDIFLMTKLELWILRERPQRDLYTKKKNM